MLLHGVVSSQLTWWRLKPDLEDLGWQVYAVDMLGHGSRHAAGPDELTIDDLAQDVLAQIPGPVNVLAGHSLGSIVAITLVGLVPEYCDRVVVEDPPGLGGSLDPRNVADGVEEFVRVARADPAGTVGALLEENPMWSRRDAENSVENRLMLQVVDNGVGGADVSAGSGLAGLAERLDAVDGVLVVDSPAAGPTRITAELPWRQT